MDMYWNLFPDLIIEYDRGNSVYIYAPETSKGTVCGMCGNFDGDPLNEFMSPNNHLYDNVRLFGDSWAYISPTTAGPLTAPVSDTLGLDQVHPCSLLDSVSVMINNSNNLFNVSVVIFKICLPILKKLYHVYIVKAKVAYLLNPTFYLWQDLCPGKFWLSLHCWTLEFFAWQQT